VTEGFRSISTRTIQKSRFREQKKMSSTDSGVPNIEKLSNDNYGIWVMKMEAVLKLQLKLWQRPECRGWGGG